MLETALPPVTRPLKLPTTPAPLLTLKLLATVTAPFKVVAPVTPSVPPRVVAPVPTLRLLAPETVTLPANVVAPATERLPVSAPLTLVMLPLLSIRLSTVPALFWSCNKSPVLPPLFRTVTALPPVAAPCTYRPVCVPLVTTETLPLLVAVLTPTNVPSSYSAQFTIVEPVGPYLVT